ncbi:helix-turn-helix domain-containing protein [Sphingobacterium hungaricum]|uniref:AraC family transcriptional regulator n=1 Tax=Sphingobacterium hungaricum TaxID=2082723 RepID=A0A928USS2_9SPHI|nr:helix-turn-helix transcriptional regulator [Sphingobacterium hungaricum]MBE8712072.1 AraC family transcriptional regulator [Sphingobacterium hungaricum]
MNKSESISEFYVRHGQENKEKGQFNVYRREEFACDNTALPPNRRDFYKISMIANGSGILSYADRIIHIDKPTITFLNPLIPYSWEPTSTEQAGYFCLFTEEFIHQNLKNESLSQSPLFKVGGNHVFFPSEESMLLLQGIFESMFRELNSSYSNKYDLLRSYVQIIMHEALKMQLPESLYQPNNSSERISSLFLELVDRQYPIDAPSQRIKLKTANEFAAQLNVHTNSLNRALKDTTGKTTSELIAERMSKEAKALLNFSNWDIAEIAYSLGFEHSSNFINFFKKQTGSTPLQFRKEKINCNKKNAELIS